MSVYSRLLTRRAEHIKYQRVLNRITRMRHVARQMQDLIRADDQFTARRRSFRAEAEAGLAADHHRDLFVLVSVRRDIAAPLEKHARDHRLLADHALAFKQFHWTIDGQLAPTK